MSSCVCAANRYRMRKYGLLLVSLLAVACADFGPAEEVGRGKIAGTVTEAPGGEPIDAVDIRVRTADGETTTFGYSIGGTYEVGRLSPGVYVVTVIPPSGYQLASGTLNNVPVTIESDETETVNFQLRSVTAAPRTSVPPQARN